RILLPLFCQFLTCFFIIVCLSIMDSITENQILKTCGSFSAYLLSLFACFLSSSVAYFFLTHLSLFGRFRHRVSIDAIRELTETSHNKA
ncbi:MAG: hypothetical protein KDK54_19790, partial [Leptospiraceae bacterium]|nr:hypothetical protein [Leptospiraceae bacterium]